MIDFYGSRLRSWSFLCVTFRASLFVHALWVFTSKISQTSLGIHPKPKTSFFDHLLVHKPIWVWSKILDEDSDIIQDYRIYAYFSSHFPPSFMLEDEHRSSMREESSHHLWQMLCKCYVAKVLRRKRKKWKKEKKVWWVKDRSGEPEKGGGVNRSQ
jgi:hypothetical protein